MKDNKEIFAPVSNVDAQVSVYEYNGKYLLSFSCGWRDSECEVSKEFYDAWVKEFGTEETE